MLKGAILPDFNDLFNILSRVIILRICHLKSNNNKNKLFIEKYSRYRAGPMWDGGGGGDQTKQEKIRNFQPQMAPLPENDTELF